MLFSSTVLIQLRLITKSIKNLKVLYSKDLLFNFLTNFTRRKGAVHHGKDGQVVKHYLITLLKYARVLCIHLFAGGEEMMMMSPFN